MFNRLGHNDFTPVINIPVGPFSNTTRRQCFSIEITSDTVSEDTENFFIDLTVRPGEVLEQVIINPDVAEVIIYDDDSE